MITILLRLDYDIPRGDRCGDADSGSILPLTPPPPAAAAANVVAPEYGLLLHGSSAAAAAVWPDATPPLMPLLAR